MTGYEALVGVGPERVHDGAIDLAVTEAERHVVHGPGETQERDHAVTAVGRTVLIGALSRTVLRHAEGPVLAVDRT
jgi:hypothetical protein